MRRFTQYLYEYQQDRRVRNIGFVKMESRNGRDIALIQARGLEVKDGEEWKLYLIENREGRRRGVLQGGIPKKKPMITYMLEEVGGSAEGVLLADDSGKRYAAVWGGDAVDVGNLPLETEEERRQEPTGQQEPTRRQEPTGQREPIPQREPEPAVPAAAELAVEPPENICEKIQRKDLARLPRKDWKLANNNFLLHGFYNYHHLLWIEEDNELYIGVPGVRHARELQAAKAFGFTGFRHISDTDIELSEEERDAREEFGYFCRRIIRNE